MDRVPVIKVNTNDALKATKELKDELKQLKDTLLSTAKGTEEYNKALQRAADIQHTLKEQMEEINASAMDFGQIMGNVVNATGGIVSGFQAAKATMNLFGVENEEVMKSLQKMQNLMAITQALPGIEKGLKSLKRFVLLIDNATSSTKAFSNANKTMAAAENASATATKGLQGAMTAEAAATGTATVATHTFKKALISTGIGAIVVLVGTLIAHLEDLAKWLGFGGDSAEALEKKTLKLKQAYESTNATLEQYSTHLEGMKFQHEQRAKALQDEIDKMKAAGASETELATKRKELLALTKEAAQEEVEYINKEQQTIEKEYLRLMKSIAGSTYSTTLSMSNMYNELAEAQRLVLNNEQELARLEANNGSKKDIKIQKQRIEQAKQRVTLLNTYIGTQKEELSINDKVRSDENKLAEDRAKNAKKAAEDRKKLTEEYKKFANQINVESKKGLDKELAQLKIAEEEKLAKLEEYHKKKIISEEEYRKQRQSIIAYYDKLEAQATYAAQELRTKKVEELEKKNVEIQKNLRNAAAKEQEMALKQEETNLIASLAAREIPLTEFYKRQEELILQDLANKKKLAQDEYNANKQLIDQQIADNEFLMQQTGITPERAQEIMAETQQLYDQLIILDKEYAVQIAEVDAEMNATRTESRYAVIEAEMEALTMLRDSVTSAMDAIIASGDGLSSSWATAFDTLSSGILDLTEKVKAGKAGWADYAQMAVAGLSAAASMMSALAEEQDTETKEGFEKQKQFQIAGATMNMFAGIVSAWAGAMQLGPIAGPILGAINSALILTTGLLQINKIKQQKFDSKGSSGASNPSAAASASVIAPVQYTQDVQGANIEGAIKDTKVYVTETDITDTQNRVSVQESENTY